MLLSSKKLHGMEVQTESGHELGRITQIFFQTETQDIEQYEVSGSPLKQLFGKTLLINRKQVVRIEADVMIVEDGVAREQRLAPAVD